MEIMTAKAIRKGSMTSIIIAFGCSVLGNRKQGNFIVYHVVLAGILSGKIL